MLSLRKIQNNKKISTILILTLFVLLIGSAGLFYFLKHNEANTPVVPSSPASNSAGTKEKDSSGSASIGNSKDTNTDTATPPKIDPSVTPQTPVGTFVSNHHPNLDGQPAPNTIDSTCTTTAGVMCTISFTSGTTVLSLPAQQADQDGNVSWTWKLEDIDLSEGSWSITATATNGDKSTFATDPMKLEVGP